MYFCILSNYKLLSECICSWIFNIYFLPIYSFSRFSFTFTYIEKIYLFYFKYKILLIFSVEAAFSNRCSDIILLATEQLHCNKHGWSASLRAT